MSLLVFSYWTLLTFTPNWSIDKPIARFFYDWKDKKSLVLLLKNLKKKFQKSKMLNYLTIPVLYESCIVCTENTIGNTKQVIWVQCIQSRTSDTTKLVSIKGERDVKYRTGSASRRGRSYRVCGVEQWGGNWSFKISIIAYMLS